MSDGKNKGDVPLWLFVLLVVLVGVTFPLCMWAEEEVAYRRGQIDAANGIMRYELVVQPDGSSLWQRMREADDAREHTNVIEKWKRSREDGHADGK